MLRWWEIAPLTSPTITYLTVHIVDFFLNIFLSISPTLSDIPFLRQIPFFVVHFLVWTFLLCSTSINRHRGGLSEQWILSEMWVDHLKQYCIVVTREWVEVKRCCIYHIYSTYRVIMTHLQDNNDTRSLLQVIYIGNHFGQNFLFLPPPSHTTHQYPICLFSSLF